MRATQISLLEDVSSVLALNKKVVKERRFKFLAIIARSLPSILLSSFVPALGVPAADVLWVCFSEVHCD